MLKQGANFRLSFSTGIVSGAGRENSDIETLLALADELMYEQKSLKQLSREESTAAETGRGTDAS